MEILVIKFLILAMQKTTFNMSSYVNGVHARCRPFSKPDLFKQTNKVLHLKKQ